ncbi:21414_t:CDS:2, partial [Racocetra persica]
CDFIYKRNYCKQCKQKLYSEEDFDNDADITTKSTISERFSDYNTDNGFVIPDNEKKYFYIKFPKSIQIEEINEEETIKEIVATGQALQPVQHNI